MWSEPPKNITLVLHRCRGRLSRLTEGGNRVLEVDHEGVMFRQANRTRFFRHLQSVFHAEANVLRDDGRHVQYCFERQALNF